MGADRSNTPRANHWGLVWSRLGLLRMWAVFFAEALISKDFATGAGIGLTGSLLAEQFFKLAREQRSLANAAELHREVMEIRARQGVTRG